MIQQLLFPLDKPQGVLKRVVGRTLALANARAPYWPHSWREPFYALKRQILERYGNRDGTDWQEITKHCWGCEACRDEDSYSSRFPARCDGHGIFARRWIPLARWQLGSSVFHVPGEAVFTRPEGITPTFTERIRHREVSDEDARAAFVQLLLWFDIEAFRRASIKLFAANLEAVPF